MKKSVRFRGNESFIIREGWINKGLVCVSDNPKLFSENSGADQLGVGSNMAKAIRYWLRTAGLIQESVRLGTTLSPLGELILEKDPYIEHLFTLWVLHCEIATNISQATAWNLFFNRLGYEEFSREELMDEMKELTSRVLEEFGIERKVSSRSIEDDCAAILHMYASYPFWTQDRMEHPFGTPEEKNVSPFMKLGLISQGKQEYRRNQPRLDQLPEEVVLYLLAKTGQRSFQLEDLLTTENSPGRILQLSRNGLMELLDRLEAGHKITINRTAGLYMIYLENEITEVEVYRFFGKTEGIQKEIT